MLYVETVLRAWALAAIPITVLVMYLTVNKLWVRRNELVVVESVSVAARLLAMFSALPYLGLYMLDGPVASVVKTLIVLSAEVFLVLIGIGFWVRERRELGLWANIRNALRLERSEAGTLLRDVFHPVAARQLVRILTDFALIDRELEERERRFIKEFAARWNIDAEEIFARRHMKHLEGAAAYTQLRESVDEYLRLMPPAEQARQLIDVLTLLSQADERTAAEEEVMLDELLGMIDHYASGVRRSGFLVLIAPQNQKQLKALSEQQDWPRERRLGGEVLRIGRYYSRVYAEMVCEWYRRSGYLTFTTSDDDQIAEQAARLV